MPLFPVPKPSVPLSGTLPLVASKSESNRALILQSLAGEGVIGLENLSAARDTRLLEDLLQSDEEVLDARDAGTTLRFLTARCVAANRPALITGTPRMCQRPIGILVDALRTLGAEISYEGEEGYPPLRIHGFSQQTREVNVRGDVSSQYISALLLVGPFLRQGIRITLEGEVASRPYIDMTIGWMKRFGLTVQEEGNVLQVDSQTPVPGRYVVESDWSAAGYWYTLLAFAGEGELELQHLRADSLQGDRAVVELFARLGVRSRFSERGLHLTSGPRKDSFEADFTHIPDQAQTFAVCCAGLGIPARLTGLKSLRIKETDRIAALQTELAEFGCSVTVVGDDELHLPGTPLQVNGQTLTTYEDHRMAMAFAPLVLFGELKIDEKDVVAKSYPSFWEDLERLTGERV
jgi:3-phosphoshikimate 1-carboxyvinyltransferase